MLVALGGGVGHIMGYLEAYIMDYNGLFRGLVLVVTTKLMLLDYIEKFSLLNFVVNDSKA